MFNVRKHKKQIGNRIRLCNAMNILYAMLLSFTASTIGSSTYFE